MGECKKQKKIAFSKPLLITLFAIAASRAYAVESPEEFSFGNILGFAGACAEAGDYYRAYWELDRLVSYYPGKLDENTVIISKCWFLFMGKRYDVLKELAGLRSFGPSEGIFFADGFFASKDYTGMSALISHQTFDIDSDIVRKRKFLAALGLQDYDGLTELEKLYGENYSAYRDLSEYAGERFSHKKSPFLAAALGLFPGGGYFYSGSKFTGLAAFAVVSLSGVLSWAAFVTGNKLTAVSICVIGTLFYGGSILGGYMEAVKYNRALKTSVMRDCADRLDIIGDLKKIYDEEGIGRLR